MNQILNFLGDSDSKKNDQPIRKKYIYFLRIQLCLSILFIILCICYWSYISYSNFQKEQYSKQLADNFSIRLLYNSNGLSDISNNSESQFVIGIIQIDKLSIHYPILYTSSEEFLKIAPCRFFGPLPNKPGNLCIAGHNYDDSRFFSRIQELINGDLIQIYDTTGKVCNYIVYDRYEVVSANTTSLNQNTNNVCEITLVTCNNLNNHRIIVKAKQI